MISENIDLTENRDFNNELDAFYLMEDGPDDDNEMTPDVVKKNNILYTFFGRKEHYNDKIELFGYTIISGYNHIPWKKWQYREKIPWEEMKMSSITDDKRILRSR